ncbi:MAG: hypothetical protein EBT67_06205 [Betaproteobacteria bacterium]|nr:hypothetical protein [Betaproteobacteria bacterium]
MQSGGKGSLRFTFQGLINFDKQAPVTDGAPQIWQLLVFVGTTIAEPKDKTQSWKISNDME